MGTWTRTHATTTITHKGSRTPVSTPDTITKTPFKWTPGTWVRPSTLTNRIHRRIPTQLSKVRTPDTFTPWPATDTRERSRTPILSLRTTTPDQYHSTTITRPTKTYTTAATQR